MSTRTLAAFSTIRTEGPMAPEISLDNQRPAADVHSLHVERELVRLKHEEAKEGARRLSAAE